ncbi:MAG: hypothetical protein C4523_10300 [Myxococcales bacterium]|nr:MAG: hypothetical protein C4523_10300 [Myxococcales bacterium]
MTEKKYRYMGLMDLGMLRRGPMQDRLIGFYELFGARNPDSRFTIWTPEEIAMVIGMPDGERLPKGKRLSSLRAKLTRRIGPDSEIIRNGPLAKVVGTDGRYTWMVCDLAGLPNEALAILNRKAPPSIHWCRRSQIPGLMAKDKLDSIPNVYLLALVERKAMWCHDLPGILDWDEPACWEFWAGKAMNAISGKNHPLASINDPDLRLQVALSGVETGVARNLDRNPDWEPDDPWAWTLHALSALVGRERDWKPMSIEEVRRLREETSRMKGLTVRHLAEKAAAKMAVSEIAVDADQDADAGDDADAGV